MQYVTIIILIIMLLVSIIFTVILAIFIYLFFQNKHRVEIREILAGGEKKVIITKAREVRINKGRVKVWKIRGERDPYKKYMPVPPNEVIERDNKGRNFVVVYRTETGEYIFRRDPVKIGYVPPDLYSDVPKDIEDITDDKTKQVALDLWKKNKYEEWLKKEGITVSFQPYTTNQRLMQVHNVDQAERKRRKGIMEALPLLLSAGMFVLMIIFVVVVLAFWKDLTAPAIEKANIDLQQVQLMNDNLNILKEIKQDIQIIKSQDNVKGNTETPPN